MVDIDEKSEMLWEVIMGLEKISCLTGVVIKGLENDIKMNEKEMKHVLGFIKDGIESILGEMEREVLN